MGDKGIERKDERRNAVRYIKQDRRKLGDFEK